MIETRYMHPKQIDAKERRERLIEEMSELEEELNKKNVKLSLV